MRELQPVSPRFRAFPTHLLKTENHEKNDTLSCTIMDLKRSKRHEKFPWIRSWNIKRGICRITGETQLNSNVPMIQYEVKSLWEIEIADGYMKSLCFNFVNFSVNLKN